MIIFNLNKNGPTVVIIIVTIIAFIIQMLYPEVSSNFVMSKGDIFTAPYTLLTHMFLHADFSHLLFNMFGVLIFGQLLETRLKQYEYYLLYFGSGLIAGLVGNFIYDAALGASAGVMALVGASAFLFPKVTFYLLAVMPIQLRTLAFIYFIFDFVGALGMNNVANTAHIIGMASGIGVAFLISKRSLSNMNVSQVQAHISRKNSRSPPEVVVFDRKNNKSTDNNKRKNISKLQNNKQRESGVSVDEFSKKKYVTIDESNSYLNPFKKSK
ncbi:MAG: rhomboid family intramembrane serine protease [Candidatus Nanoarchaeia archaeon]